MDGGNYYNTRVGMKNEIWLIRWKERKILGEIREKEDGQNRK